MSTVFAIAQIQSLPLQPSKTSFWLSLALVSALSLPALSSDLDVTAVPRLALPLASPSELSSWRSAPAMDQVDLLCPAASSGRQFDACTWKTRNNSVCHWQRDDIRPCSSDSRLFRVGSPSECRVRINAVDVVAEDEGEWACQLSQSSYRWAEQPVSVTPVPRAQVHMKVLTETSPSGLSGVEGSIVRVSCSVSTSAPAVDVFPAVDSVSEGGVVAVAAAKRFVADGDPDGTGVFEESVEFDIELSRAMADSALFCAVYELGFSSERLFSSAASRSPETAAVTVAFAPVGTAVSFAGDVVKIKVHSNPRPTGYRFYLSGTLPQNGKLVKREIHEDDYNYSEYEVHLKDEDIESLQEIDDEHDSKWEEDAEENDTADVYNHEDYNMEGNSPDYNQDEDNDPDYNHEEDEPEHPASTTESTSCLVTVESDSFRAVSASSFVITARLSRSAPDCVPVGVLSVWNDLGETKTVLELVPKEETEEEVEETKVEEEDISVVVVEERVVTVDLVFYREVEEVKEEEQQRTPVEDISSTTTTLPREIVFAALLVSLLALVLLLILVMSWRMNPEKKRRKRLTSNSSTDGLMSDDDAEKGVDNM